MCTVLDYCSFVFHIVSLIQYTYTVYTNLRLGCKFSCRHYSYHPPVAIVCYVYLYTSMLHVPSLGANVYLYNDIIYKTETKYRIEYRHTWPISRPCVPHQQLDFPPTVMRVFRGNPERVRKHGSKTWKVKPQVASRGKGTEGPLKS